MRVVITMTSWTKRIQYVAKSIFRFIKSQTVKPDIFYLWLAEEEFPNKEDDLPEDLLLVCEGLNVKICWTKDNEYCFKRWYVYPKHYNDIVISIDDDPIYPNNLIAELLKYNSKYPNTILNIPALGYRRKYNGSIHNDMNFHHNTEPDFVYSFCGQCLIPPKCFPLEAFTPEMNAVRKKICPVCDESWFNPFFVYNGVKQFHIENMKIEDSSFSMDNALWPKFNEGGPINKRDKQLYEVLKAFPEIMDKWKKVFPEYKC
jgi:hypothetical protein